MTIVCVIPVRGGSKGVPGKNIRPLGGIPLVAWSIRSALAVTHDVHVIVSTDSEQIRDIARSYGAHVPFLRPAELATDQSPSEPAIEHALGQYRHEHGEPEGVLFLQATSPLRLPGTLDRAIDQFRRTGVDSLVGVVPMTPFIWRSQANGPVPGYDPAHRLRRQDMSSEHMFFRENGSLYLTRPYVYDREHNRIGGRVGLFQLQDIEGVDIDTEMDFRWAEQLVADHHKELTADGHVYERP